MILDTGKPFVEDSVLLVQRCHGNAPLNLFGQRFKLFIYLGALRKNLFHALDEHVVEFLHFLSCHIGK